MKKMDRSGKTAITRGWTPRRQFKISIRTTAEKEKIASEEANRIASRAQKLLKKGPSGIVTALDEWINEPSKSSKEEDRITARFNKRHKLSNKDSEYLRQASNISYFYEFFMKPPLNFRMRLLDESMQNLFWQMRLKANISAAADMLEKEYDRLTRLSLLSKYDKLKMNMPVDVTILEQFKKKLNSLRDKVQEAVQSLNKPKHKVSKKRKKKPEKPTGTEQAKFKIATRYKRAYSQWTEANAHALRSGRTLESYDKVHEYCRDVLKLEKLTSKETWKRYVKYYFNHYKGKPETPMRSAVNVGDSN